MNLNLEPTKVHPAFSLVKTSQLPSLNITVIHSRHNVTGADHFHLQSDHDENAFMVAFRTQPMDSTGVAHILEHTTLCGSQKYPVRDPFFSMIRRSLNTFMNAFTSSDWTAYPFATQNKKDFNNLLSVYLDAVFFPILHPLDFAQEGIRIEVEEGKPVYKGVVFNEMKGAMSSDNEQLYYALAPHLFPTTTYHYNSGGDPVHIPKLTHQQLVDFHQSHYHPSNAIFMTFGNNDVYTLQEQFEELALKSFSKGTKRHPHPEQRLKQPVQVKDTYTSDKDASEHTYHLLSWLLPTVTDTRARLTLRLLEGILMEDSSSPLRQYLETKAPGTAPTSFSGLDDHNYEMVFYAGVQGSAPEHAQKFEQEVLDLIQSVADSEIDDKILEAIVHQIELHQREIGGDHTPYGLQLLLNGMTNAIYDSDPVQIWNLEEDLLWLKEQIKNKKWLQQQLKHYFIDNLHRVRLTLVPDTKKADQLLALERHQVEDAYQNLSELDKQALTASTLALKARQEQEDDISLLPKVGREDIPADLLIAEGMTDSITLGDKQANLTMYQAGTNGLYYQYVVLPLTEKIIKHPYFPIYTSLFSQLGFNGQTYLQSQQAQTATAGGIGMSASIRGSVGSSDQLSNYLILSVKALTSHPEAMQLLSQAFAHQRFDESQRILELLEQKAARWETKLAGAGHSIAMQVAAAPLSDYAWHEYQQGGMPALVRLKQLVQSIKDNPNALIELTTQLASLHQQVVALDKSFVLIAEQAQQEALKAALQNSWQSELEQPSKALVSLAYPTNEKVPYKQAWLIPSNVQFNASAYPAVASGHTDAPALMILGSVLRNGYLHRAIREQGGAYGGGAGYDGNAGVFRFYSYRDPRLAETFDDFLASIQWLLDTELTQEQLDEAVLGIMSSMDKPGSPAGEAASAYFATLHQRTPEFRRQLRQDLLDVTTDDLKRVTRQYLLDKAPSQAVLAPASRQDELKQMGFELHTLNLADKNAAIKAV